MVRNGYKDAGYEYIVIDDCWSEMERDANTNALVPDLKRFPNGLKYIGDYVGIPKMVVHNNQTRFNISLHRKTDSLVGTEVRTLSRLWYKNLRRISGNNRVRGN